jgi:hypothetical protein
MIMRREKDHHRCLSCGSITILLVGATRGVPCGACGETGPRNWARVGSMTEFYAWSQRADVCEAAQHRAADVRRFTLVRSAHGEPYPEPEPPAEAIVAQLHVKLCPAHAAQVAREGYLGFVLPC